MNSYTVQTYRPQNYDTVFKRIQYNADHTYLYVSTNSSSLLQYSCSNGYAYGSLYTYYPALAFDTLSNGYIVLMSYLSIIRFTSTSDSYIVSYNSSANIFAASYKDNEFVYLMSNFNYSSCIYLHYGDGSLGQTISYQDLIMAIDAT